jgi:hypothetical protein
MAQRALQDEDDIPFSIPNANSASNLPKTVENHSSSNSTTKISTHESCKIINQKDELLNNTKNYQDANSNNDTNCCKCTLF